MTFIELLKMTILFQKIINSVAQFVRIIIRIFRDYIFDKIKFFFDNIEIKKLKTIYNDEKITSSICKYMTKYIRWLNDVFVDIERANCTISDLKSHFCIKKLKIVKYCEGIYRGFVLICKKFDIEECWGLAHFRTHTQLNATKKIEKFAWNAIYLIAATESFFLDHLII